MEKSDLSGANSFVRVDLRRRVIYLGGEVDDRMAIQTLVALDRLDAQEGDISLIISSGGGSETAGYAIFDAITMCKNNVIATGYGLIASITAAIFQAADERRLAQNSVFMIHNGDVTGEGTMQQNAVLDLAEQIRKDNQRYYTILATASNLPLETVETYCREETWFTAAEAVEVGFADSVLKPVKKLWSKTKKKGKRK